MIFHGNYRYFGNLPMYFGSNFNDNHKNFKTFRKYVKYYQHIFDFFYMSGMSTDMSTPPDNRVCFFSKRVWLFSNRVY